MLASRWRSRKKETHRAIASHSSLSGRRREAWMTWSAGGTCIDSGMWQHRRGGRPIAERTCADCLMKKDGGTHPVAWHDALRKSSMSTCPRESFPLEA